MGGFVVVLFFGGHLIFDCFKLIPSKPFSKVNKLECAKNVV